MKQLMALLQLTVLFLCVVGCNRGKNADLTEYEREQEIKEANLKIASDSIVSLSFCGLTLGEPATAQIQKAVKENRIKKRHIYNNPVDDTYEVPIYLPTQENPIFADLVIATYNDTIANLCITSDDFATKDALIDLYLSRYDDNYASLWDNNSESSSKTWNFKNQTLTISSIHKTEDEVYVKNPKMKSPENRYGVKRNTYFLSIVINYSDNRLSELVKQENDSIAAENRKKKLEDDAKRVNLQHKKAADQDI